MTASTARQVEIERRPGWTVRAAAALAVASFGLVAVASWPDDGRTRSAPAESGAQPDLAGRDAASARTRAGAEPDPAWLVWTDGAAAFTLHYPERWRVIDPFSTDSGPTGTIPLALLATRDVAVHNGRCGDAAGADGLGPTDALVAIYEVRAARFTPYAGLSSFRPHAVNPCPDLDALWDFARFGLRGRDFVALVALGRHASEGIHTEARRIIESLTVDGAPPAPAGTGAPPAAAGAAAPPAAAPWAAGPSSGSAADPAAGLAASPTSGEPASCTRRLADGHLSIRRSEAGGPRLALVVGSNLLTWRPDSCAVTVVAVPTPARPLTSHVAAVGGELVVSSGSGEPAIALPADGSGRPQVVGIADTLVADAGRVWLVNDGVAIAYPDGAEQAAATVPLQAALVPDLVFDGDDITAIRWAGSTIPVALGRGLRFPPDLWSTLAADPAGRDLYLAVEVSRAERRILRVPVDGGAASVVASMSQSLGDRPGLVVVPD